MLKNSQEANAKGAGVPTWYTRSTDVVEQFQMVSQSRKIVNLIESKRPLYDRIMGDFEQRSNRAAMHGPLEPGASIIVDVGCGTGHLLSLVANRYRDTARSLMAIDLSQNMLDEARSFLQRIGRLYPFVSFRRADCRSLPLEDESCDLYVSSYLFDMLPAAELPDALSEMQRVLRPGGQAMVSTMTLEVQSMPRLLRCGSRAAITLYNAGYRNGRWNGIWGALFCGYAPHCRPIDLGERLREHTDLRVEQSFLSRVTIFPVRIYYLRKPNA